MQHTMNSTRFPATVKMLSIQMVTGNSVAGTVIEIAINRLNHFKEDHMKKFIQKIENAFAAVAFAEEGEFGTAREIMHEDQWIAGKVKTLKNDVDVTIDNLTAMAIAFAEDGEVEKAREILHEVEDRLKKAKDDLSSNLVSFYEKYA